MDLVSLIILNGKLEMVSKDELDAHSSIEVFDAKGSFLLGNLAVGDPANFLILNKNPSDDLGVLLDVNSYLEFAVKEGELVANNLGKDTNIAESGDRGRSPDQARSYQPLPVALPSSTTYTDSWFHYDTGFISGVFTGVLAVDSMRWGSQDLISRAQSGDLKTYDGSEVKGFEIGVDGSFNFKTPWAYKMFIADNTFASGYDTYKDDNVTVRDLAVAIPLTTETTVTIGKQKEPISLERITGLLYLPSQNRTAAADAMLRSRNVGVNFNSTAFAEQMTWSGGVFNDWLDDEGSVSENSTELIGRVTFLPYVSEDESRRLHLGLGARLSNAADPVRFLSKPEFGKAPVFVDTDTFQAETITSYNVCIPYSVAKHTSCSPENIIANLVPMGIINIFEVIKINEHDDQRPATRLRHAELPLEIVIQTGTIKQPCQSVTQGLFFQRPCPALEHRGLFLESV